MWLGTAVITSTGSGWSSCADSGVEDRTGRETLSTSSRLFLVSLIRSPFSILLIDVAANSARES